MVAKWGTVHIMVNNASVTSPVCLSEIGEEERDRVMGTNMKGTLFCSQAVIPYMKKQQYGRSINQYGIPDGEKRRLYQRRRLHRQ